MPQKQSRTTLNNRLMNAWRTLPSSSPQRWFVVVALLFGSIFATTSLAFAIPDEFAHAAHAWHLAKGEALAERLGDTSGSYTPTSFRELGKAMRDPNSSIADILSIPLNPTQTYPEGFPNLVAYSPLVYLPQAIGMQIGELFNLPVYFILTLGRLANLIAYVFLFYWAIRLLPFGKWVGVALGLFPMHILLAGSLSADPVSIGLVALTVSVVLYARDRASRLTKTEYLALLGFTAALALTKLPFPLLIALFLLLPVSVLGGTVRRRWQMLAGIAAVGAIVGCGWLLAAKGVMVPYSPLGVVVDPGAQLMHILHYPLGFIKTVFISLVSPVSDMFLTAYVISVGPVRSWLPVWATFAYTIFLVLCFFGLQSKSKAALSIAHKQLLVLLGCGIIAVIALLLYVSWTPVGAPVIDGMQARYFTPLLILLLPLVTQYARKQNATSGILSEAWYRYVPVAFLLASIVAAFYYFYTIRIEIPF